MFAVGSQMSGVMNNAVPKILVVDKQPNERQFLARLLTKQGYTVETEISGESSG